MKKILAAAVLALTFSIAAGAQGQDIRYRDIKDMADTLAVARHSLWFDVEQGYKTIISSAALSAWCCGLM